jgi:hypothetical protein
MSEYGMKVSGTFGNPKFVRLEYQSEIEVSGIRKPEGNPAYE